MSSSSQNRPAKKLLAVLYSHPEGYPPTLNALGQLAGLFDEISVLFRPILPTEWPYPENVKLCPSGEAMNVRVQEQLPVKRKIALFLGFVRDFRRKLQQDKPDVVLLYDALPVLAFSLVRAALPKGTTVWYHNHDVLEAVQKRFSLNWFAYRLERKMLPHLDLFTLPAQERKRYFPMETFRGQYFFLPNQPSVAFYRQYRATPKPAGQFRVIYQGHVDEGHGIEEILAMMPCEVQGRPLRLVLKGWLRDDYRAKLTEIIAAKGLEKQVEFVGYTAYQELPKLTASCHVGIAIHTKTDVMNKTLGTASNKIYEYAAVGLPVLYFDNPHFRQHLGPFGWAIPTDLTPSSLRDCFGKIASDYERISSLAIADFETSLNFEYHFAQIKAFLQEKLGVQRPATTVVA